MNLLINDIDKALRLIRRVRQTCQTRVIQLATCRVCGADQAEFEAAVKLLKDFEHQLEKENDIQVLAEQSQPAGDR